MQTDIVWRALEGGDRADRFRADVLFGRPATLDVGSTVAAAEVLGLAADGSLTPVACELGSQATLDAPRPGCLVYRLAGRPCSYVEMVHPVDFRQGVVRRSGGSQAAVEVAYRLFPDSLEKGVILRARLRGLLIARQDDAPRAAALYAAFAAGGAAAGQLLTRSRRRRFDRL